MNGFKMVFTGEISSRKRALAYVLAKYKKHSYSTTANILKISKSSVSRIVKRKGIKRKSMNVGGRPRKLSMRDERILIRNLRKLRKRNVNFTVKQLLDFSGFDCSSTGYRSYVRCLHRNGYRSLQTRKKGILSELDITKRLKWARNCLKSGKDASYWENKIGFYLDGVSFIHKTNPCGEALSPKGRVWRKRNEGLTVTSKGSKALAGGRRLHLLAAISHGQGVILLKDYETMNGLFFANFIKMEFSECFKKSGLPFKERLFVMDNDPSQNSAVARQAMVKSNCKMQAIPARSPDLNPIENLFHNVKEKLNAEAIDRHITKESFAEFKERVFDCFMKYDREEIDRMISSMPRRIENVIKQKGGRTKY